MNAQLNKKVTNHSLWAYGTTEMFQNGVPEKAIQARTGHRSIGGLCQYERVSDEQNVQISTLLKTGKDIAIEETRKPVSIPAQMQSTSM